jgi:hypothetical protein
MFLKNNIRKGNFKWAYGGCRLQLACGVYFFFLLKIFVPWSTDYKIFPYRFISTVS